MLDRSSTGMHVLCMPLSQYFMTWTMRSPRQVTLICYEIHSVQDVGDFCSMFTDHFSRIGRELTNLAILSFDKILEIIGYSIEYYE